MSHTSGDSAPPPDQVDPPALWQRWYWPVVSLLALLALELTASPTLSAVLLCGHFGLDDWRTGLWLWRSDPDSGRGRACGWFSFARGVTCVWIASLILLAVVLWVAILLPREGPANQDFPGLLGVGLLLAVGAPLSALLGLIAILSARRHAVKVWLDPGLHHARKAAQWPPTPVGARNLAAASLVMTKVVLAVLLIFGLYVAVSHGAPPPPADIQPWVTIAAIGLAALVYWFSLWADQSCAQVTWQCWPDMAERGTSTTESSQTAAAPRRQDPSRNSR
ncbi:MAG: hypothetical protein ACK5TO_13840 [Planctomycetaceae bacterium]